LAGIFFLSAVESLAMMTSIQMDFEVTAELNQGALVCRRRSAVR
jgi:hypothetical protein